jgi:hypothetical protein
LNLNVITHYHTLDLSLKITTWRADLRKARLELQRRNLCPPSTLNPPPSTRNPQPSTLNPQILNPQPATLNPQPATPPPGTLDREKSAEISSTVATPCCGVKKQSSTWRTTLAAVSKG